MRAQYYDATVSRFITEDPVQSSNLYTYGGNNPIKNIDPSGKFFIDVAEGLLTPSIAYAPGLGTDISSLPVGSPYEGSNAAVNISLIALPGVWSLGDEVLSVSKKVHGNSLKSLAPTWGYQLYSVNGTFLKNGITSKILPQQRYSKEYLKDKILVPIKQFDNRLDAYFWEYLENFINKGPLNKNMH